MPWHGFRGTKVGAWAEEGFARWLDIHCIDAIGPNSDASPPTVRLHTPNYFPDRYFSGNDVVHHYEYAALAFDVLFAKDEKLMDAVLESRSNPAAMSEIKDRINRFYPALFGALMTIQHEHVPVGVTPDEHRAIFGRNIDTFKRGLGLVLGSSGVRWEEIPDMSDVIHEQIQKKLREHEQKTGFSFR